ncbi:response regulator transcription factor [Burkholderia ubonensis]|uniref:response regulator transcription factor n=1 Tax=Burkholderia ubonensis TaxID=101571 RepID=UPI0009B48033|nr:response regulator transcription factor [Burkholderia ubonensis]
MSILLVEDDPAQASIIEKVLRNSGREVCWVCDDERAVQVLRSKLVELVVLDWRLPATDGLGLLYWIRTNLGDEPTVLFLTARMLETDVVAALEAGADEYIAKPVRENELAARINALLRRNGRVRNRTDLIRAGPYVLNSITRTVALRGEVIDLTTKEFVLANCLFDKLGSVVSRDLLATLAWGRTLDGTSRSLDTHIYRLRQKLRLRPENGFRLSAVYTHGYRLDAVGEISTAGDSILSNESGSDLMSGKASPIPEQSVLPAE